jgi:hypothetical protein
MFYQIGREPIYTILSYALLRVIILLSSPNSVVGIPNTRLRIVLVLQDLKLFTNPAKL